VVSEPRFSSLTSTVDSTAEVDQICGRTRRCRSGINSVSFHELFPPALLPDENQLMGGEAVDVVMEALKPWGGQEL
jgi:hypothetical protein